MIYEGNNTFIGTWTVDTDIVLTKTLYQMREKYYGENGLLDEVFIPKSSDAYGYCKYKINRNLPCLLTLNSHSVVCKGYEEYEYCWTEKEDIRFLWWKTGTREVKKYKTYRYLAIDLGWGNYGGATYNSRGKYDTCAWISEDIIAVCCDYSVHKFKAIRPQSLDMSVLNRTIRCFVYSNRSCVVLH